MNPTAHDPAHGPLDQSTVNWSEDLEEFHEESTRDHPIEVLTRTTMIQLLGELAPTSTIVEVGCSTGYLLEDLCREFPKARVVGFDLIASGLHKAHRALPDCQVAQADACALPVADDSADAVMSVNLLEHVPDDTKALAEIRRILRPGATAVLVIPAGPSLYDYYDRFLHHERRYASRELADKARSVGLEVHADMHLGSVVYPAFWLLKKRKDRVRSDYGQTKESPLFTAACTVERWMLQHNVRLPFGIRGLTVVRKPSRTG
jgi:SAM-dependent methyltransferase